MMITTTLHFVLLFSFFFVIPFRCVIYSGIIHVIKLEGKKKRNIIKGEEKGMKQAEKCPIKKPSYTKEEDSNIKRGSGEDDGIDFL